MGYYAPGTICTWKWLLLIIFAFEKICRLCVSKLGQNKEIFQYMKGLLLNHVEISVENLEMKKFQDMENIQDLKANITNSIL